MSLLISEMLSEEKPRERFKNYGVNALSNEELISIILRCGTKNISVKDLSQQLLQTIGSLESLPNFSINKLSNIKGLGEVKAITLLASIELGKRVYFSNSKSVIKLDSTTKVYEMFKYNFLNDKQEKFVVIFLDIKKNLINYETIFIGTVDQSTVHPREIFKNAYLNSASFIICMHNHPTGDPKPSPSDVNLTSVIKKVSNLCMIPLLDHMIIGNNNYFSFLENNQL